MGEVGNPPPHCIMMYVCYCIQKYYIVHSLLSDDKGWEIKFLKEEEAREKNCAKCIL